MSRIRVTNRSVINGTWSRFGSSFGNNGVVTDQSRCVDEPGKGLGDNMPLEITHMHASGGVINANPGVVQSYWAVFFRNYICDTLAASGIPMFPLITSYPGEQSNAAYAAMAVARTNPNKPHVDIPVSLLELGDVARLIKLSGDSLINLLGNNYLRYQFGIKPIVRDVSNLIKFADLVHKRMADLERLKKTSGLRKTVTLDTLSASQMNNGVVMQSTGGYFACSFETIGSRKIRGHTRWVPDVDFNTYDQREMLALAKRSVLGLEVSFSTLWEAMPWSWLIDWYTNIGDLLMQTRNIIPVSLSSVTLMRETTSRSVSPKVIQGDHTLTSAVVEKTMKERYPGVGALDAQMPFLSASQVGILTSLAAVRLR
nr:MAG: hypothetical protein 1 [Leviviridae sp.]